MLNIIFCLLVLYFTYCLFISFAHFSIGLFLFLLLICRYFFKKYFLMLCLLLSLLPIFLSVCTLLIVLPVLFFLENTFFKNVDGIKRSNLFFMVFIFYRENLLYSKVIEANFYYWGKILLVCCFTVRALNLIEFIFCKCKLEIKSNFFYTKN